MGRLGTDYNLGGGGGGGEGRLHPEAGKYSRISDSGVIPTDTVGCQHRQRMCSRSIPVVTSHPTLGRRWWVHNLDYTSDHQRILPRRMALRTRSRVRCCGNVKRLPVLASLMPVVARQPC